MNKRILNKSLVILIMLLFIGVSVIPSTGMVVLEKSSPMSFDGNTLYVGGDGPENYSKIQDAIDNANEGDTVFVYDDSSPYFENVVVDKSINLTGENRNTTTIDGNEKGDVVYVSADYVTISGFTIQNSGDNFSPDIDAGIDMRSDYLYISNNNIGPGNNLGINLWFSDYNNIIGNTINTNDWDGIYLYSSSNNYIQENTIFLNVFCGVFLHSSRYNVVLNNNVYLNNVGGIYMKYSNENIIFDNIVEENNEYGIKIYTSSNDNILYHNNIIGNNQNAHDECNNIWDNDYPSGGNYWDDYTGNDTNGDGIGDTPYNIAGGDNQDLYPFMYPNGWINQPPYEPSNPYPENGARYVPVDAVLNWTGGDPNPGDIVTYDVYFGVTHPPGKKSSNQSENSYDPYGAGGMVLYEEYYWKIVSWDNHGASTAGPIWHFTTDPPFPPEVEIVNPREGYFHFSGIPLSAFKLIEIPVTIGGFKLRPIQVNVSREYGGVWVQLYIDDKYKGHGTWNPETGYYEWEWTERAFGTYNFRVVARDIYGLESWASLEVINFCLWDLLWIT